MGEHGGVPRRIVWFKNRYGVPEDKIGAGTCAISRRMALAGFRGKYREEKLGAGLPASHGKIARRDDEDHGDCGDSVCCG